MTDFKTKAAQTFRQLANGLYKQYSPALLTYLARRLSRPEDADDLAQEVFMRLLRVKDPNLIRQPQKYLFGIASNVVSEFYMNRDEADRGAVESLDDEPVKNHPSEFSTEEHVDRLVALQQLEKGLAKLPPMHQAVVLYHKRDGHSIQETAKLTGLTFNTVEKYYTEAKARLKSERMRDL